MERFYNSQQVYTHISLILKRTRHTHKKSIQTVVDQGVDTILSNVYSSSYVFKLVNHRWRCKLIVEPIDGAVLSVLLQCDWLA